MAIRLLSIATLLLGALLSVLFFIMQPMARSAACPPQQNCPGISVLERLVQSSFPFVVSISVVALVALVHRKRPRLARTILAVPLVLLTAWIGGLFVASFLGQ